MAAFAPICMTFHLHSSSLCITNACLVRCCVGSIDHLQGKCAAVAVNGIHRRSTTQFPRGNADCIAAWQATGFGLSVCKILIAAATCSSHATSITSIIGGIHSACGMMHSRLESGVIFMVLSSLAMVMPTLMLPMRNWWRSPCAANPTSLRATKSRDRLLLIHHQAGQHCRVYLAV